MPRALPPIALALASLACASAGGPPPAAVTPVAGRVSQVSVVFTPGGARVLDPTVAARTAATVRQSARDWLEQEDRLGSEGELAVEVDLDSAHLRSPITTWLFAAVSSPDHLAATVSVLREGMLAARYPVRVESGLAGYGWRDPDERLDRLARRLGQRVAEGL